MLILGSTGTGKTTLMREIAAGWRKTGRPIVAHVRQENRRDYPGAKTATDADGLEALLAAPAPPGTLVIIDDAQKVYRQHPAPDRPFVEGLAGDGRHAGHVAVFIAHNPTDIPKRIRANLVGPMFAFRMINEDYAKAAVTQMGAPKEVAERIRRLENGAYILAMPGGDVAEFGPNRKSRWSARHALN